MFKVTRKQASRLDGKAKRVRLIAAADALDDLLDLLAQAVRAGFHESKAERLRAKLLSDVHPTRFSIVRLERVLRKWIAAPHEEHL
jgi:hypothetical protein